MDDRPDDEMADDDPRHWTPRASDGKVYCCKSLGWVTSATAADHRWDSSRPPDEYKREYAGAWKDIKPGV